MVNGSGGVPVERGASAEPSLEELAEKLLELKQHFEQAVRSLNHAISEGRANNAKIDEVGLRCHACGRTTSVDEQGWTLRLCGDDELHPFCPDCDRQQVDRSGHAQLPV
jgi:hypothetical protein